MHSSLTSMGSLEASLRRSVVRVISRSTSWELFAGMGARRDCSTSADTRNFNRPPHSQHFRFYPLDGSMSRVGVGLQAIREMRPKQIMLETCDQRKMLAERRLAASMPPLAEGGSEGIPNTTSTHAGPISQTDAIDIVHGGIRGGDLVLIARAAADVGAQVYMVDRPYRETQNSVARQLVLNPSWILPFIRHSLARLSTLTPNPEHSSPEASQEQNQDLSIVCPGIHSTIASGRERYMAEKVAKFAVKGSEVFVFCTMERIKGLETLLADGGKQVLLEPASKENSRFANLWPILLVFIYCMTPMYVSMYLMWHLSQWLASLLAEGSSRLRVTMNSDVGSVDAEPCKEKETVA